MKKKGQYKRERFGSYAAASRSFGDRGGSAARKPQGVHEIEAEALPKTSRGARMSYA